MSHRPPGTTGRLEFVVPGTPPSYNETRYTHWRDSSKVNKLWIVAFETMLIAEEMPHASRVKARAELTFPERDARGRRLNVRRDQVNYRTPVEKALGDALTGSRHKTPLVVDGELVLTKKTRKPRMVAVWPKGRFMPDDDPAHFNFIGVDFLQGPIPQTRVILRWWIDPR